MPKAIAFPLIEPRWVFDRDSVSFFALADSNVVRCLVSSEALYSRFGAKDFSQREVVRAFKENREAIELVARKKIEIGNYKAGTEVLLRTDDFGTTDDKTTMAPGSTPARRGFLPIYEQGIIDTPAALKVAREATTILREEMALGTELVRVVWDVFQMPEQPLISLDIFDDVNNVAVNGLYTIDDLANSKNARFAMFLIWDELLSARIIKYRNSVEEDKAAEEVK